MKYVTLGTCRLSLLLVASLPSPPLPRTPPRTPHLCITLDKMNTARCRGDEQKHLPGCVVLNFVPVATHIYIHMYMRLCVFMHLFIMYEC